jgi:predicted transcriptional regulator
MKKSTNIALSDDIRAGLDQLAVREDRSRSWLAETAIRQFLATHSVDPNRRVAPGAHHTESHDG